MDSDLLSANMLKPHYWSLLTLFFMFFLGSSDLIAKTTSKTKKAASTQKRVNVKTMTDDEGVWVANFETNIYEIESFGNTNIGYSTKNGWDVSLSLLNFQITDNLNCYQCQSFINITKTFDISEQFNVSVGSLNGITINGGHSSSWLNLTFFDTGYDITSWLTWHGGAYIANAAMTGTTRQIGFLTGVEIDFIPNKLELQIDYISGHHALSGASINMLVKLTPLWQIYFGALVPEQNTAMNLLVFLV